MITRTKFLTTAVLLGLMASPAWAEDKSYDGKKGSPGGGGKMFEQADTNKDGFLTKDEMLEAHKARVDKMFTDLDTDKDGKLSREELNKGREKMRDKMKERLKERGERDEQPPQ